MANWKAPIKAEATERLFGRIKGGKQPFGGIIEGYFGDWPSDAFYQDLSDEEASRGEGHRDTEADYGEDDKSHQEHSAWDAMERERDRILSDTSDALALLPANIKSTASFQQKCLVGRKLAIRALRKLARARETVGLAVAGQDELLKSLYVPTPDILEQDAGSQADWLFLQGELLLQCLVDSVDDPVVAEEGEDRNPAHATEFEQIQ